MMSPMLFWDEAAPTALARLFGTESLAPPFAAPTRRAWRLRRVGTRSGGFALDAGGEVLTDRLGDLGGGGRAAQVPGVQGRIGGNLLDGPHHTLGGIELAQVLQEHDD